MFTDVQQPKVKAKVLIVDDERIFINLLAGLLSEDYKIMAATNGEQALYAAKTGKPDLILLDVKMPDMTGYAVCAHLKEDEETRDIPVIFITGLSDASDEELGLSVGAVDYISKPFSSGVVRARVRTHVRLKRQSDLLAAYAYKDGLTHLYNRRALDERLESEWNRGRRQEFPLSVIIFDVDQFKLYNDHYGHGKGDECLTRVAGSIGDALQRASDFPARYGGEEFVVVLPHTDLEEALVVAERLRAAVEVLAIPHEKSTVSDVVTASFGVANALPGASGSGQQLVEQADSALYRAKSEGRNRCVGIQAVTA